MQFLSFNKSVRSSNKSLVSSSISRNLGLEPEINRERSEDYIDIQVMNMRSGLNLKLDNNKNDGN